MNRPSAWLWLLLLVAAFCPSLASAAEPKLALNKDDKIVLIGNTLAERMQYYNHWETLLASRFPELNLTVRNLGWSADEVVLRPRSQDFKNHGHNLTDHKPDVIIAMFGFNESFGGEKGLNKFERDLEQLITSTTTTKFEGKEKPPQLVLVSPIAHENLGKKTLPDGELNNKNIALYTKAMQTLAAKHNIVFIDLFSATKLLYEKNDKPLTINGVHLNRLGDEQVGEALDMALFGARPASAKQDLKALKDAIAEKNLQHFYDYRAVNGFYIYGGRKNPFGTVNFPAEFAKLRKMVRVRDERIWKVAKGESVSATIDDTSTGDFTKIESNVKKVTLTTPDESMQTFKLADGYKANLFASEQDIPELQKPVQMSFDAKGRLWVCTMPSYPMYLPGTPVNDKLLILEDTDGDGKADKRTVFADKLHLPTGFEFAEGGVYIAQQPNLLFLKDTDGDDKADERELVLHGFDSADSHHSISAFTLDQGGAMYFQEGTFHRTQVETPYGPVRVHDAAVFRFEPRTWKFSVFVSYGFANPWGHYVDKWGQNFVADASGGANYYGTAFSGDVDYPNKHKGMSQFIKMQWRPTSGCELVSSRHFPAEAQGNYLLNNCIGFQGVLNYKMREEKSGFAGDPTEPLLRSTDPNFRPVDLEFGPDGALYVVDWYNPLVGHMQHSVRDPNRDATHGRIYRITYEKNPLLKSPKIAGEPIDKLLDVLKTPEDRVRYRARIELRDRPTDEVIAATLKWMKSLDEKDPNYWLYMTEGLWMYQSMDVVNEDILKTLLRAKDYHARAAATRVLCYWRDRVKQPLELLRVQAADEHPRVRLEAVRALSFFRGKDVPTAQEIVLESTLLEQDKYLEYTVGETTNTLDRRAKEK